jgi:hypothetical protein
MAPSSLQKRVMLRGGYKNRVQDIDINMTQSPNSAIRNILSGDIGSSSLLSSSTSPRGISDGMLKLVLRLELPLLERPGLFPVENEARRGEGGSTGDGEAGGEGADDPPSSNVGISVSGVSKTIFGLGDARTTLDFVQFSIVAYIWRLWLRYLHLTILL